MSRPRVLQRTGSAGFGGMGQFGGAFLLINALSGKIYELINEASQVITKGYETGGVLGLARSNELRMLLKRYLWLISLVFAYEKIRWLWSFLHGFKALTKYLYIDATLKTGDQAYEWILAFWEHSSGFRKKSRDFIVETGAKSSKRRAAQAMLHGFGENIFVDTQVPTDADLQTRITPKDEAEQWFINAGTVFRLRRRMQTTPPNWMIGTEATQNPVITIRCYSLTRKPLFKLLKEAKAVYDRTRPQMITIRVLDARGSWRRIAYKARRPLANIIMEPSVRDSLLEDAREFLKSEDWYAARGLRWNRGYLLHGAPGTGKSSTIQALASELKLDVYIISINSPLMSDSILTSTMRSIPPKSIVVMEDVDAVFSTQKRELSNVPVAAGRASVMGMYPGQKMGMQGGGGGSISLSAALNAIDGIESADGGRILMMSTNVELSELDPALTRPGRVDLFINYKRATRAQAEELYNIFYRPAQAESELEEDLVEQGIEALDGDATPDIQEKPGRSLLPSLDLKSVVQNRTRSKPNSHHPFDLPPHVTESRIAEWAKLWAAQLEDEQFTIAELQGMLLFYKKDPETAVKEMSSWVAKELAKREAEAEKERLRQEERKAQGELAASAPTVSAPISTSQKEGKRVSKKEDVREGLKEEVKKDEETDKEEKATKALVKLEKALVDIQAKAATPHDSGSEAFDKT